MTTMTSISQQAVHEALMLAQSGGEPVLQPAILMHRNIDHDKVGEYAQCCVNDSWATNLKKLMDGRLRCLPHPNRARHKWPLHHGLPGQDEDQLTSQPTTGINPPRWWVYCFYK